jgi:hypothetical protein
MFVYNDDEHRGELRNLMIYYIADQEDVYVHFMCHGLQWNRENRDAMEDARHGQ